MNRFFWIFAVLAALFSPLLAVSPAQASGDVGCEPMMKIFFDSLSGCDSMGFLSPGNDTRVNLTFLLADRKAQKLSIVTPSDDDYVRAKLYYPTDWESFSASLVAAPAKDDSASDEFATGEGTVCVSYVKGNTDFAAAVDADKDISESEKTTLKRAREGVKCANDGSTPDVSTNIVSEMQSANAKEFAAYLAAVMQFYGKSHVQVADFTALANSPQPWVREASRYMEARVALLAAQADAFSDYGTIDKEKINAAQVKAAKDALDAYLKDYPQGTYAASATGLLRRAAWLSGDTAAQLKAYSDELAKDGVNAASLDLVNELDFKLPPEAYLAAGSDVLFLATDDLKQMRAQTDDDGKAKPGMAAAVLEKQKPRFAGQDELFAYLLAARAWFVDKDAKAVLQLLPEKAPTSDLSYLEFSRQLLRAAAMEMQGDKATRAALVAIFPFANGAFQRGTLELALAMNDERNKNISAVFAPDSLIKQPPIREEVLDYIAGPILLRQQANDKDVTQEERDTALYRLYSRDLVQGHFKGFLEDIKLLPPIPAPNADGNVVDKFEPFRWKGSTDGYSCPDIVGIAEKLVANAKDIQGQLCLGDFFRLTGVTDVPKIDAEELGGTGTLFAGAVLARQDFYVEIMKDAKASHQDRAYALFRAVHCYEPAHQNDCGGKDVDLAQRKAWHDELKAKYGDTPWAKELHYYW